MDARSRAVLLLGVTQIIGYGTLYYSFGVLAGSMAQDLGVAAGWVYGAFSVALLFGGLASPRIGRALDRYGAGPVMTAGSVLSACALVFCGLAPERYSFALGLVFIEIAAIFVLYEAAFALLVQTSGPDAGRRITHLTLIAGFASTIFWPLTSLLVASMSWREVFFVFAALHLAVCLPAHLYLSRQAASLRRSTPAPAGAENSRVETATAEPVLSEKDRSRAFALLLFGFALTGFVLSAVLVHMIPVLEALGLGAMSAFVGAVFGPAQVLSRIVNMGFGRGLHPLRLAILSSALLPVALMLLAFGSSWLASALVFSVLFGLGAGLTSIVRGTVPLAVFGAEGFGSRVGAITSARLILASIAPFAFALALERLGIVAALAGLCGLGLLSVLTLVEIERMRQRAYRRTGLSGLS